MSSTTQEAQTSKTRIQGALPLLEAFGNASTTLNHNSSRFAKFTTVEYDQPGHALVGACIQTFLLERSRVTDKPDNEANFHIFYMLLRDCTDEELASLYLVRDQNAYGYLASSVSPGPLGSTDSVPSHPRDISMHQFREALSLIGIERDLQWQILQVVSAVLLLGKVSHESVCQEKPTESPLDGANGYVLASVAALLGIAYEDLRINLANRVLKIRNETMYKPLSTTDFLTLRDSFGKMLYTSLFHWLVEVLNTNDSASTLGTGPWIGIFDIFGFEDNTNNSLEQLCINYANEKLQTYFTDTFLKHEQRVFKDEGLPWDIAITDNSAAIHLFEGHCMLFELLDEECRLNRQKDSHSTVHTLSAKFESHLQSHEKFFRPLKMKEAFGCCHYAGDVVYSTAKFVAKNKEKAIQEHKDILDNSKCIVAQMFWQ